MLTRNSLRNCSSPTVAVRASLDRVREACTCSALSQWELSKGHLTNLPQCRRPSKNLPKPTKCKPLLLLCLWSAVHAPFVGHSVSEYEQKSDGKEGHCMPLECDVVNINTHEIIVGQEAASAAPITAWAWRQVADLHCEEGNQRGSDNLWVTDAQRRAVPREYYPSNRAILACCSILDHSR